MITPKQLIEAAAKAGGVTVEDVKSKSRLTEVYQTRWVIFWYLVYGLNQNQTQAARALGKDPASVYNALVELPKLVSQCKQAEQRFLTIHEEIKRIDRQSQPSIDESIGRLSARARGEAEVQAPVEPQSDQAQEIARLRAGITEALELMKTEPLSTRLLWMPIRDILTDAMGER